MLAKQTLLRKSIRYNRLFINHEIISDSMTMSCNNVQLQILIKLCRLGPVIWLTVSGANRFNAFYSHEAEALRVWPKCSLSVTKSHKKERWRSGDWVHIFPLEKYQKDIDRTPICGKPRDGRVDGALAKHQKGSSSWISMDSTGVI